MIYSMLRVPILLSRKQQNAKTRQKGLSGNSSPDNRRPFSSFVSSSIVCVPHVVRTFFSIVLANLRAPCMHSSHASSGDRIGRLLEEVVFLVVC